MRLLMILVFAVVMAFHPGFAPAAEEAPAPAPEAGATMDTERMDGLIKRIDPNVQGVPGNWQMIYEGFQVRIVTDPAADRMRIVVPVARADVLEKEHLLRLMQANYDTALDARYAIAQEIVWSTFIHPLGDLTEKEFFSGLGQTITLAATFGTTFSSGALVFGGGDSGQILQDEAERHFQDIQEKGLGDAI